MNLKAERQSGGERPFCTKITQAFKGIVYYSAGEKKQKPKNIIGKKPTTPVLENKQTNQKRNGRLGLPPSFAIT